MAYKIVMKYMSNTTVWPYQNNLGAGLIEVLEEPRFKLFCDTYSSADDSADRFAERLKKSIFISWPVALDFF